MSRYYEMNIVVRDYNTGLIEEAAGYGLRVPTDCTLSEAGNAVLESPGDWVSWWEDEPETCTALEAINHALENTNVTDLNRAALMAFIEQARWEGSKNDLREMAAEDYSMLLAEAVEDHGLQLPGDSANSTPTSAAARVLYSDTPWRAIWQDSAPPCGFFDVLEHVVSRTARQQKRQSWSVPYTVTSPACAALVAYVEFWRWVEFWRRKKGEV